MRWSSQSLERAGKQLKKEMKGGGTDFQHQRSHIWLGKYRHCAKSLSSISREMQLG